MLCHFPLVAHLLWMYQAPQTSKLMTWHAKNQSINGKVRHVPDSKAWRHIDATWPEFINEVNNVKLGFATNGFNAFGEKSNNWSTWPILLLKYNLPPWLLIKRFFTLLSLIILRLESMRNSNFDVYFAPLLEDLVDVWNGVARVDVQ